MGNTFAALRARLSFGGVEQKYDAYVVSTPLTVYSGSLRRGARLSLARHHVSFPLLAPRWSHVRVSRARPTQQLAHRTIAIVYLSTSRAPHEGQTAERDLALPFAASAGGALFEDEHNHHEAA